MSCNCDDSEPLLKSSLIQAGKSVIKHFLNPTYQAFVSDEIKEKRLKICNSCENLTSFLGQNQCSICKCFLGAKASLIDQNCPDKNDRWEGLK